MTRLRRLGLFTSPPILGLILVIYLVVPGRHTKNAWQTPVVITANNGLDSDSRPTLFPAANEPTPTRTPQPATQSQSPHDQVISKASENADASQTRSQLLDSLASRVSHESKDPLWSSKTEELLVDAFSPAKTPGTTLESTVCGSTLCRVTLTHTDNEAQMTLAHSIFDKEPFASASGVYYSYNRDGAPATTLYLLRREVMKSPNDDPPMDP
jgi:hypothetical protein